MTTSIWSCVVRRVAREWKEEVLARTALETALRSGFDRIDLVVGAARAEGMDVTRAEKVEGPIYQIGDEAGAPAYYYYRYRLFYADASKEEWDLRCQKTAPLTE